MLVNLDHESKLHAWLLQGMTKTRRIHWKECADYYKRFRPTLVEVYPQEYGIKWQHVKAINHIGASWHAGTFAGCDWSGTYIRAESFARDERFVTCLWVLYKVVLEWSLWVLGETQDSINSDRTSRSDIRRKQAEEYFHPQLEAHLVTWITMKLPNPVKTRAYNRRSQPSVRILLTEFYFTLLHSLANRQGIWEIW